MKCRIKYGSLKEAGAEVNDFRLDDITAVQCIRNGTLFGYK